MAVKKSVPVVGKVCTVKVPEELLELCIPLEVLKLWDKNPRYNEKSSEKLAALIREQGEFVTPLVIDQDNVIRAGNTRYKAAKLLGMTSVPCVRKTFKSEAAAVAFGIGDNKAGEWSDWDSDKLRVLLDAEDIKMGSASGFKEEELKGLHFLRVNETEKKGGDKDKIILMVLDASIKEEVKEKLFAWVKAVGINVIIQ